MKTITETKKKLTIQQLRNAAIIAEATSGKSIKEIAEEHGRNRKWLSIQLNHSRNQELFSEIYEATIAEAVERLPALVRLAFDIAEKEMQHPYDPARRMTAAKAVLSIAGRHWQPQPSCTCSCNCKDEKVIQSCEAEANHDQ
jgi:transposase-like protein